MTETPFTRRRLLATSGTVLLGSLAGCGDYPRNRSLTTVVLALTDVSSDGYRVKLKISKDATTGTQTWETFHDVHLVGYAHSGELACKKALGDISQDGEVETITLTCSAFPYVFTFDAAKSPCDEDTRIMVTTYEGKFTDLGHHWGVDRPRTCKEGLPPRISSE